MIALSFIEVLVLPKLLLDDLVPLPELSLNDVLLENLYAALLLEAVAIASDSFSTTLSQP